MANDNERKLGLNAKRLLLEFMAREAIPPGGGIGSGLLFFADSEHRRQVMEAAKHNFDVAIEAMRSAPDNPYGDDEEAIAAAILDRLEAVRGNQR